ncbi:signal peptidase I [Brachybacterium avium]|uniref:Signal peptidase I n=1 Tax=Brachybacterium avium TaxID=2017485 RepID=A0A220UBG4_9MICO|nr:signal peptidase I [Brachybacterium avium]ASK65509.1 signal peptidase I [Brachybacterium avium]
MSAQSPGPRGEDSGERAEPRADESVEPVEPAPSQSAPRPGRTREVAGALLNGLSVGVLLLILGLGVITVALPALVGGMPLSVLTGSMRPTLPPGTLVVVKPVPVEEIGVGDVITFQIESGKPAVVTHRVIARSVDSASGEVRFTTQGDANNTPDPEPVRPAQVRGKVWYAVPYLGWVNQAVDGQTRSWAIPVLAGVLFLYAAWTVGSGVRDRRRAKRERVERDASSRESSSPPPRT